MAEKELTADRLWFIGKPPAWQKAFDAAGAAAERHEKGEIKLDEPISEEMLSDVLGAVIADHYRYLGISSRCFIHTAPGDPSLCDAFWLRYHRSAEELENERAWVSDFADSLVANAERQYGANPLAKAMYFAWWLITSVDYGPFIDEHTDFDVLSRAQSAHGAFIDRRAVCYGFSRAFQMLCGRANIECFTVLGSINGGDYLQHAWNMVFVGEKAAYVDLCFSKSAMRRDGDVTDFPFLLDSAAMEQIGYCASFRAFAESKFGEELEPYRFVRMMVVDKAA